MRRLSGAHLVALAAFFRRQGDLADSDRIGGISIPNKVPLSLPELRHICDSIDETLLKVVCIDLANMGLLVDCDRSTPSFG
jgi:hypothetical protein